VTKKGASSFFGSTLAALLTGAGADTVVVCGARTSGCVRATVVDAVQSGFNVLVPADCCADRAKAPHDANLYDMAQKYADVTDSADILNWLSSL
jgi:maleamate amidohydrolase